MTILDEPALETPDRGTPPVLGAAIAHVTIDGISVMVPVGTSVMRAASLAGVAVPKLCATDSLKAFGSCRLCLVEVEGLKGTPASCTTPCTDGMVVSTRTEQVQQLRRGVMKRSTCPTTRSTVRDAPGAAATCSDSRTTSGSRRSATGWVARPTWPRRPTSPTPTSPTTRPPASSARAACEPAPRPRAPSR